MAPLELTQVLAFKPTLRVERLSSGVVFLIGEHERFVLSGRRTAEVAALVDGRRTVLDIMNAAIHCVSEAETLYTLDRLMAAGYLVPAAPEVPSETAAFWHGAGIAAPIAADALRRTPVSVRTLGEAAPAQWMTEALEQAGVRVDPDALAQLVVTDDYLRPELLALNRTALLEGTPWGIVKPIGIKPLIGPIFHPGAGPCWDCLAFWMRNNRPVEELVAGATGTSTLPSLFLARSSRRARAPPAGSAALAIARALAGSAAGSPGTPRPPRSSPSTWPLSRPASHAVVKRPQCPTCGDPGLMAAAGERPIELQPVEKGHLEDGGYRRRPPRRTYERYRHLVSPITGPVTHLVPMPGRDTELRAVYASGYLVCPREGVPQTNVFDKVCAGKGRGAEQARVSALCEALERYSGVYQGDEARIRASRDELGPAALPPGALLDFSEAQYRGRDRQVTPAEDARRWVPEPLGSTTRIDWTPAWSLSKYERRYVPLAYCYAEAPTESGTATAGPTATVWPRAPASKRRCSRACSSSWSGMPPPSGGTTAFAARPSISRASGSPTSTPSGPTTLVSGGASGRSISRTTSASPPASP